MKIAAIIPSRYDSTRFKGKPLVKIDGISMVERVYRQAKKTGRFSEIIVATDDKRIADEVDKFGGISKITSKEHNSGTERLFEVLENSDYDAALNIQGDEPLIPEALITGLYDQLKTGKYDVVTAAFLNKSYEDFLSENVVKVILDRESRALYFSRSPVPFAQKSDFRGFYNHVGIYGYKKSAVEKFVGAPISDMERSEKLEQLRFLDNNITMNVIVTEYRSFGVDVPEDVEKIEKLLKKTCGEKC